ncbi:MAG: SDR family NAD(P)-dependent oxidoreductase [Firmicutes bacterium]|nr:SDR family NAD(P)-dependent oxidoreductase [Bacillota bacterium]
MVEKIKPVAVVVGGSSGIGFFTLQRLINKGYTVYNLSRTGADLCKFCDGGFSNICCDVAVEGSVAEAIAQIYKAHSRIDVLVYSAGASLACPLEHITESDFRRIFEVNYFGFIKTLWEALPIMRRQKSGRIVVVSSLAGSFPVPFDAPYSASKSALDITVRSLALELKPFNIKLTAVCPGGVSTAFTFKRKIYGEEAIGEYFDAQDKACTRLANIEQGGLDPMDVATRIVDVIESKNPPITTTVGISNRAFRAVNKILPIGVADWINGTMYR